MCHFKVIFLNKPVAFIRSRAYGQMSKNKGAAVTVLFIFLHAYRWLYYPQT